MFVSLPHWLVTTFVMTLGEMNYAENFMPWELFPFSNLTNVLFVIFVFAMPIILMNMLVRLLYFIGGLSKEISTPISVKKSPQGDGLPW